MWFSRSITIVLALTSVSFGAKENSNKDYIPVVEFQRIPHPVLVNAMFRGSLADNAPKSTPHPNKCNCREGEASQGSECNDDDRSRGQDNIRVDGQKNSDVNQDHEEPVHSNFSLRLLNKSTSMEINPRSPSRQDFPLNGGERRPQSSHGIPWKQLQRSSAKESFTTREESRWNSRYFPQSEELFTNLMKPATGSNTVASNPPNINKLENKGNLEDSSSPGHILPSIYIDSYLGTSPPKQNQPSHTSRPPASQTQIPRRNPPNHYSNKDLPLVYEITHWSEPVIKSQSRLKGPKQPRPDSGIERIPYTKKREVPAAQQMRPYSRRPVKNRRRPPPQSVTPNPQRYRDNNRHQGVRIQPNQPYSYSPKQSTFSNRKPPALPGNKSHQASGSNKRPYPRIRSEQPPNSKPFPPQGLRYHRPTQTKPASAPAKQNVHQYTIPPVGHPDPSVAVHNADPIAVVYPYSEKGTLGSATLYQVRPEALTRKDNTKTVGTNTKDSVQIIQLNHGSNHESKRMKFVVPLIAAAGISLLLPNIVTLSSVRKRRHVTDNSRLHTEALLLRGATLLSALYDEYEEHPSAKSVEHLRVSEKFDLGRLIAELSSGVSGEVSVEHEACVLAARVRERTRDSPGLVVFLKRAVWLLVQTRPDEGELMKGVMEGLRGAHCRAPSSTQR